MAIVRDETVEVANTRFRDIFVPHYRSLSGTPIKQVFRNQDQYRHFQHLEPFYITTHQKGIPARLHISFLPFQAENDENRILILINPTSDEEENYTSVGESSLNIFDSFPGILLVLDENTNILNINDAALRLSNHSRVAATGIQPGNVLNCLRSYDSPEGCGMGPHCKKCKVRATFLETLMTGKIHLKVESPFILLLNENTVELTVLVSSTPVFYEGKKAVLVIIDDITDRKKLEQQIELHRNELSRKNNELNAMNSKLIDSYNRMKHLNSQLENALDKAEESDRLKSAFLENLSHEVRTPLNGIVGFSELLNENTDPETTKTYVKTINQCSRQLLTVIGDVMDLSMIESGQASLKSKGTNIFQVCSDLFEKYSPEAREKGIEFLMDIPADRKHLEIVTDKEKLTQAISNLLNNAIKFTLTGTVKFGYRLQTDQLQFWVKDTGIGIEPENHRIIFERFRQARLSDHLDFGGNGLGLTISKAWIELLGGSIRVESFPGRGSTFSFSIPLRGTVPHTLNSRTMENKSTRINLDGKTILVAEDDITSFEFIEAVLLRTGATLIHAYDGEKALELALKQNDINLILMDLKLPLIDGAEATARIKSERPDLAVVIQTACCLDSEKKKALASGCNDYIEKPYTKDELLNCVLANL